MLKTKDINTYNEVSRFAQPSTTELSLTACGSYESVEDLAFAHWKYAANEKAYQAKLIPKPTYEFAKNELQKTIDNLSRICYDMSSEKGCR